MNVYGTGAIARGLASQDHGTCFEGPDGHTLPSNCVFYHVFSHIFKMELKFSEEPCKELFSYLILTK